MSAWEIWGILVQHVGNILSVALVLALLSGRKEARATLGWVLLVVFLPYAGAVAYLCSAAGPYRASTGSTPPPARCPAPSLRRDSRRWPSGRPN